MAPKKPTQRFGTPKKRTLGRRRNASKLPSAPMKEARSTRQKFALVLTFSACFALIVLGWGYHLADLEVLARVGSAGSSTLPAIYSDKLTISRGAKHSIRPLLAQLAERRYRDASSVSAPGEFHLASESIEIFSREFRDPFGQMQPAQHIVYNPAEDTIVDMRGKTLSSFSLEPTMIAPLSGSELKAANFQPLNSIPMTLQHALLAIEDQRFYLHFGIDLVGLLRALGRNLMAGRIVQGGSTLTQQLAKNMFFSSERSFGRKFKEALAAISLEQHLTKAQILELYLNEVYLGQEGAVAIHGVAEAANTFFGKRLQDLSIGECALIAGVIQAPSLHSPRRNIKRALKRRNLVLAAMREQNFITELQLQAALLERPIIMQEPLHRRTASYYVAALRRHMSEALNFDAALLNGISVYTGLSAEMQRCAENAISTGLEGIERRYPAVRRRKKPLQAALVAIEPYSGQIRAWVGGRDFAKYQFDRVDQSQRQVGSAIKPFLYLTALDRSLNDYRVATAISILPDRPMQVDLPGQNSWNPENYDRSYRGDVTLRYALENSLNIPAVYLGQRVGIKNVVETIKRFRAVANPPVVPSLALGAVDTSLLDLTAAYGALANGGVYVTPRLYLTALDGASVQISSTTLNEQRVADESAVAVLTNIMQGVVERGTARAVRTAGFTRPVAGKTGTSNDARDSWFVGFTPDLVAGVWVGYDDNSKVGLTGGQGAVPIWSEFMKCSSNLFEAIDFITPPGVLALDLDASSGERATPQCPIEQRIREIFVRGTEPMRYCHLHGGEDMAPAGQAPRDARPEPGRTPRNGSGWFDWLSGW